MDSSQDLTNRHHYHLHQQLIPPQSTNNNNKKKSIKIVDLPFVYNNNAPTTNSPSNNQNREEPSYRTRIDYTLNGIVDNKESESASGNSKQEDDMWTYKSHAHRIFSHECLPAPDVVVVVENEPQPNENELPPPPVLSSPPTRINQPQQEAVAPSEACFRTSSVQIPNGDEVFDAAVRGGDKDEDCVIPEIAKIDEALEEIDHLSFNVRL